MTVNNLMVQQMGPMANVTYPSLLQIERLNNVSVLVVRLCCLS